jgi:steroid delta-isomerase
MPTFTSNHEPVSDPRTAQAVRYFETLTRASLDASVYIYTEDARFKDPFNEVQGRAAINAIFDHMFDTLIEPRFKVLDAITEGNQAFLTWDFTFRRKASPAPMTIHGGSHLHFAADGRIAVHRDYWDAAEELYAKLPLLGTLMRWLRRQLTVKLPG